MVKAPMLHSAVSSVPIQLGGGGGGLEGGCWEGRQGGRRGGRFPGGGGGRAPPNSWICGLGVIRQFTPPLPTIEGRVSSAWVFPATLGTEGGGLLRRSWD